MKLATMWGMLLSIAFASAALAEDLSVAVSVTEPAGVARTDFPATGGVPFVAGTVKDVGELVLVDGAGKPVAAQFSRLASYDDGSVQWALVDVLVELPAGGTAKFTVTLGTPAPPAKPLKTAETDDAVTFDTGVISFTASKTSFSPLAGLKVGAAPLVASSELSVTGGAGKWYVQDRASKQWAEQKNESHAGKTYAAGRPTRVKWEYRGPVRATLRVDGEYEGADGKWLAYTTRITAWAGCGAVRLEHSIRNSNPAEGDDAYIARAPLTLTLAAEAADAGSGEDWAAGGDGSVGLLVQDRHTAGIYRGPGTYLRKTFDCGWQAAWPGLYGQKVAGRQAYVEIVSKGPASKNRNGELGFTADGVFALADRSHKDSEIWLEGYAGSRDAAANEARAKGFRSKLLVVAEPEWYSRTEALGMGHFGTLADEIAVYKKWGWKGYDDQSKYPKFPHQPDAFVPAESIHDVSEDDAVAGYLLQFLRTGERGFFDWAEAYDGFYRGHAIFRRDWGERWGTPDAAAKRASKGQPFGWYEPHVFDWADTRMHGCHHYGRGIFDYYCMTGNTDSLEAGLDLADELGGDYLKVKPGGHFSLGRAFGRSFLTVLRAWQVTRDEKWKKIADHYAALILKADNWDPKIRMYRQSLGIKNSYFARDWATGHFDFASNPGWKPAMFRPIPPRLDEFLTKNRIAAYYSRGAVMARKGDGDGAETWEVTYLTQVFELSACHLAMERYARMFKDADMRQRLLDLSEGVASLYWSDKCQFMIGSPWFGWPQRDKTLDPGVWEASHDKCPADGGGVHSGYATRYTADMFARCYSNTADPKWLELAKRSWSRGAKRLYERREQCAADDEVPPFAYIRGAHNDSMLECSVRMFYEVARAK